MISNKGITSTVANVQRYFSE